MNIVKFKDIMLDDTDLRAMLFNKKFRGKYCYCINWDLCVSLDDITTTEFVTYSKNPGSIPLDLEFIKLEEYQELVDTEATERVNRVDAYILSNNYIPSDFTLEQIKKFRTFVAASLIANNDLWDDEYDGTLEEKIMHMLKYYANGMYDDTLKALMEFSDSAALNITGTYTDCGCGGTTSAAVVKDTSGMYQSAVGCGCSSANAALMLANTCDCVSLYRMKVHNFMVDVFSDWKFWDRVSEIVVPDMIAMLKAILEAGLSLSVGTTDVLFGDCSCLNSTTDETGKMIVSNLIKALEYIRDEEVVAHKNFIKNSLYAWASKLYEYMEW